MIKADFLKNRQLSDEDYKLFRDLIYKKSGIFFPESKKLALGHKLYKRLKALGLNNFREYYDFLSKKAGEDEYTELFVVLTTNETSFFRTPKHFEALQKVIFPELMEKHEKDGTKKIRVWSAGCSMGEEPYTIAITYLEAAGLKAKKFNFKIIATDLSIKVLNIAKEGIYPESELEKVKEPLREKYFIKLPDGYYKVKDNVKKLIEFKTHNLISDPGFPGMDVIFCRNVMIYFDKEAKTKVVKKFYDSLNPGGYFFVGHAESLYGISKEFKFTKIEGAILYRKEA